MGCELGVRLASEPEHVPSLSELFPKRAPSAFGRYANAAATYGTALETGTYGTGASHGPYARAKRDGLLSSPSVYL